MRFFLIFFLQRKRLEGRGTETKESLQKRLDTAQEALEYGRFFSQCFDISWITASWTSISTWYLSVSYKWDNQQTIHVPVKAATVWTTDQYAIWNQWKLWFVLTAEQPGSYDHIIVNDDVDTAYSQLKSIVIDVSTRTVNKKFMLK